MFEPVGYKYVLTLSGPNIRSHQFQERNGNGESDVGSKNIVPTTRAPKEPMTTKDEFPNLKSFYSYGLTSLKEL